MFYRKTAGNSLTYRMLLCGYLLLTEAKGTVTFVEYMRVHMKIDLSQSCMRNDEKYALKYSKLLLILWVSAHMSVHI